MGSTSRIIGIVFAVVGVGLTAVALLLLLEGRRIAESPSAPEPSFLWHFVVEGVLESFIPEPEFGRTIPPAEAAAVISRGIAGIAALGGFFLVGAGFAARRARRATDGE